SLQRAEYSRHRSQHARLGAIAYKAIARGFRPDTSQAGAVTVRTQDLQLPLVLMDAGQDDRLTQLHTDVIQHELRGEVVSAVDDEIVLSEHLARILRVQAH